MGQGGGEEILAFQDSHPLSNKGSSRWLTRAGANIKKD